MKRAKHTLSHYRMITGNMGQFLPIACVPVLPGDTIQMRTDALIRVSPLNTPVMHPVAVRLHHWFVPNRIVWPNESGVPGWETFITGGFDGSQTPTIPTLVRQDNEKDLPAYLGIPPIDGLVYTSLALRAANMIYNQRYRDQDLVSTRDQHAISVPRVAWEKDSFSTARPWTQKGDEITLPIGDRAAVYHEGTGGSEQVTVENGAGSDSWVRLLGTPNVTTGPGDQDEADRLYADLRNANQININDFRAGFALQRYQEARARYGSRFTEYLRYLGITPSDARINEPEFLGGGVSRLNFSEVLQTADVTADPAREDFSVGDMYGHGIGGARSRTFRKFFEEHGYIITVLSVRPKALYMEHCPREFLKRTKEDFFQKELAHIGQQEVLTEEVNGQESGNVFGYQDRYYEYRRQLSQVGQDFRSTLAPYHLGRDLSGGATLNEAFVTCDPSDRIFQVGSGTADTLWVMANHHIVARRLVPRNAAPRVY